MFLLMDSGYTYELDQYAGVMFTLGTNKGINEVVDLKDKAIGAMSIDSLGGGQAQFYELTNAGLSYVADPKKIAFTKDETKVIDGVMTGDFDVGFVRSDSIERYTNDNGTGISSGNLEAIVV
jgi:ABC-type phosphate/phosphonate transport system substrate-binding protein